MLSFYDIKKHSLYLSLVKLDDIEKILISIKHILFGKFSIITYHYKSKEKEKFIIDPHTATAFGAIKKSGETNDTVALGTAHPYKFLETVKKATGENLKAPHQLEKFIDKDEKFDIVENNNEKIKKYILNKIQ